ncbi:hypothetical protein D3C76_1318240 [compost metagenome]
MELEQQDLAWSSKRTDLRRNLLDIIPVHPLRIVGDETVLAVEIACLDEPHIDHVIEVGCTLAHAMRSSPMVYGSKGSAPAADR